MIERQEKIMILVKHESYSNYVKIQRDLTAKRTRRGSKIISWVSEEELLNTNELLHSYVKDIETIVCHGCRNGFEVNVFQNLNLNAKVFGTDLYESSYKYDKTYFRRMDFDEVPQEWLGYFDIVYSNAIDHSRDPINTLLSWKSELKENGVCFVTFHWGTKGDKADCFHLSLDSLQKSGGVYKYELEVRKIAEEVMMEVLYISKYTKYKGKRYCVNVIFSRGRDKCLKSV